jgi:hypothetical protein
MEDKEPFCHKIKKKWKYQVADRTVQAILFFLIRI